MKVVDERVTSLSDPFDPETPGAPFSGDGLPTPRRVWIENGVVKNLQYDRYWAHCRVSSLPVAVAAPDAGRRAHAGGDDCQHAARILCTRFCYIRGVDQRTILFTGLTRDGTFPIENSKIMRPIKNMRWNESPIFALNNLEMVGRPERVSSSESGSTGAPGDHAGDQGARLQHHQRKRRRLTTSCAVVT
jgi:predicted Zn-dependent protease